MNYPDGFSGNRRRSEKAGIMNKICSVMLISLAVVAVTAAQERKPIDAVRPFVVKTKQDVSDLEKSLRSDNKVVDLIGEGMETRVAMQHDKLREGIDAEVHDASDDVYYVLEGAARLILGGHLDNPVEKTKGEWKSKTITGGTEFTIKKGGLIVVPRGTPHQRFTIKGKEFSLILIKIYEDPLPVKK